MDAIIALLMRHRSRRRRPHARRSRPSRAARRSSPPARSPSVRAGRSCSRPRTCSAPARSRSAAWRPSSPRSGTRAARNGVVAASRRQPRPGARRGRRGRAACRCEVFVPADAPMAKVEAARGQGAIVHVGGDERRRLPRSPRSSAAESGGLAFVHPFDDPAIVAGQGSLGLELLEDVPDLAQGRRPGRRRRAVRRASRWRSRPPGPRCEIVGVQAAACAPYPASMQAGAPIEADSALTIADGIAVKRPGGITLRAAERAGSTAWSSSTARTRPPRRWSLLLERCKLVVEGAGAVGVAALLGGQVEPAADGTTVAILSGGNVDAGPAGRDRPPPRDRVRAPARPAHARPRPPGRRSRRLLATVAGTGANIVDVSHVREGLDLHVRETAVELVLETRGHEHAAARARGAASTRATRRRCCAS